MRLLFVLLFITNFCLGQSKKDQIESLNRAIDSLNSIFVNNKLEKDQEVKNLNTKIENLSLINSNLELEMDQLKLQLVDLQSKIPSVTCIEFYDFLNFTTRSDMDKIYDCAPPSILKAEFYKHYYEILAIENIKKNRKTNFTDNQLINLFHTNESIKINLSIDSMILYTKILDGLMSDYFQGNISIERLHAGLYRFYIGGNPSIEIGSSMIYPEIVNISKINSLVTYTAFNPDQAGDYPHGGVFEISDDEFSEYYDLYMLVGKIETKFDKIFGLGCFAILSMVDIKYVNAKYEITLPINRADGYWNSGGYIKFTTSDFGSYENLYYSFLDQNAQITKWNKL
jgi:hypothetical protein